MNKHAFLLAIGVVLTASQTAVADDGKRYKVFIFAGQSNAQGKAPISMMDAQAEAPETRDMYKHMRKDGKWIVRDDVFVTYQNNRTGPLTLGFGSPNRSGSELEFGWMMGDHFKEPVVIIKTCQGGMSLYQSFRPPSAGLPNEEKLQTQLTAAKNRAKAKKEPEPTMDDIKNLYGEWYRLIFSDLRSLSSNWGREFPALKSSDGKYYNLKARNWEKDFPALAGRTPELAGVIWFQGWNDQYGGQDEYASNMKHFIKDLRTDLGTPNLPFVIVAMGQNGSTPATGPMLTIRDSQMAMNDVPEFKGNVKAFRSDLLVDKDAERLWTQKDPALKARDKEETKKFASDDGYHYFGSAIWFMRIGHAIGDAMLELMKKPSK
ncbi:MAG: sialate O-acetylesterase [Planctomycetaceae bacterium]|nr:sialate O-acetylesterase [Planctomycetaceae bacterium]